MWCMRTHTIMTVQFLYFDADFAVASREMTIYMYNNVYIYMYMGVDYIFLLFQIILRV